MKVTLTVIVCCMVAAVVGCKSAKWSWPKMGQKKVAEKIEPSAGAITVSGVLAESQLFTGPGKRYVLRDPQTQAIRAYAQAQSGAVDLAGNVGRHVEITGTVAQDGAAGMVLDAQKLAVLPMPATQPASSPASAPAPQSLDSM